ncbi:putative hydrolase or acyltransferase of alpha/beta superfamily [Polaromonas sp. CF318]|uniref:alpha/beta fold hydrolase n=1 Tax=Polaromonas sp. CF318 TaxID=1144318 RepID=UPI00027135FA|nr:alpha/beta hydrolase [Polaromonas sp. CF318]EJL77579.1 putative hydrolase or acyltransferase of alpha/beta superfamily [Polaromonas sp. CF318]
MKFLHTLFASLLTAAMAATTLLPATSLAASPAQDSKPVKSGYLSVNGVNYHYQVHGQGEPLLLLHGGLGQVEMMGPVLAALAQTRQVIGVDLYGHGRTALTDRPVSLVDMGEDMAQIIQKLGYGPVDVMGYSMGGGVGFRLAVQHPERVRRLVLVSAGYAQDGFFPEMLPMQAQVGAAMADMMKDTPMYKSYAAVAPRPQDFPRLLDQMGAFMRKPYDYSEDVKKLAMPVMLVFGDSDMYRPEHIVKFYQLLGGGLKDAGWGRENMAKNRLAILPGFTHYDLFLAPSLVPTVLPFLDGKSNTASWAQQVSERK